MANQDSYLNDYTRKISKVLRDKLESLYGYDPNKVDNSKIDTIISKAAFDYLVLRYACSGNDDFQVMDDSSVEQLANSSWNIGRLQCRNLDRGILIDMTRFSDSFDDLSIQIITNSSLGERIGALESAKGSFFIIKDENDRRVKLNRNNLTYIEGTTALDYYTNPADDIFQIIQMYRSGKFSQDLLQSSTGIMNGDIPKETDEPEIY